MPLHEGENVGPYRVIGQLGQGGMATVYRAYHAQLNRYVAIKMMHTAFQENENFLARFRREAQIVALLEHPHIVPVYDFNEHLNQPYLVMKFIEGKTLKGTLVDGALTLEQVLHVMTSVASALTYAHSKGVLHRDIKPSNIVIDNDNVPYLTDFGLARIAEAGESTLSADMILGTPHYISPEQALGDKNLTSRTDIYSLGVVLYELVVGRVPFSADTPYAIIHDHIYTPLPLPSQVNPDLPPGVEMVLLKALAKDPNDRYETAVEMVEAFKKAASDSGLAELKADRVTNAGVSLARLRIAMNSQLIGGSTLDVPGVSSPIQPLTQSQLLKQRKRARRWMWGGIASFLMICVLSGFITLGALDTLRDLRDTRSEVSDENATPPPTNSAPPATTEQAGPPPGEPRPDAPPLPTILVPTVTVEQAQAALDEAPTQENYLALALALLEDGQIDDARAAFQSGLDLPGSAEVYMVNAARRSAAAGFDEVAIGLYNRAMQDAMGDASPSVAANIRGPFNPIRIEFGEYLYQLTEDPERVDFARLNTGLSLLPGNEGANSSFLGIFAARSRFRDGNTVIAVNRLQEFAEEEDSYAEAHLVYGEALMAQGRTADAIEQWELVLRDPYRPEWVHNHATELIATAEG